MLFGRSQERQRVSLLLNTAAAGRGGAMHILGAPGTGKTALLSDAADAAGFGWTVLRCTGTPEETRLSFAGLHLLLGPVQHRIAGLPDCQQRALRAVFGLAPERRPDGFLIGVSTCSLLAELANEAPVLCLIDDADLLDRASVHALSFAVRRLAEHRVAMVFAGRTDDGAIAGFPELRLAGLDRAAARQLLEHHRPELSAEGRCRLLTQAAGNPLALLELPAIPDDMLPVGAPVLSERLESRFGATALRHSPEVRLALLIVAAEPSTELATVVAALDLLGSSADALAEAERTGLVGIDGQTIAFTHPLQRAAIYHEAPFTQRAAVHTALATVLTDPDRRAWHLAEAATGTDDEAADALEAAAHRARSKSAYATASAALVRSAELATTPSVQHRRLLLAMDAAADAGRPDRAMLIAERIPERASVSACDRARLLEIGARMEAERGSLRTAHAQMLEAASAFAETLPDRAAHILLNAACLAWAAADIDGVDAAHTALRALDADHRDDRPAEFADHLSAAAALVELLAPEPSARAGTALRNLRATIADRDEPALLFGLALQATHAGDLDVARALLRGSQTRCRHRAMNWWAPATHGELATVELLLGELDSSADGAQECLRLARRTAQPNREGQALSILAVIAAIRHGSDECQRLAEQCVRQSTAASRATDIAHAEWALSLDDLVQGRYGPATERFEALFNGPFRPLGQWVPLLSDWVEAAFRLGGPERAAEPMAELRRWAAAGENVWVQAHLARCQGLIEGDNDAFTAALDRYAAENRWYDHARTTLLQGEFLHRTRARTKARAALRNSVATFERLDARPWTARAEATLRAAGEPTAAQPPCHAVIGRLTARELEIVRLAAAGATNREIGERLWLSPKTVAHHLYRAFPKLGVTNRGALARLDLATEPSVSDR
ncbi:helix-turn-helix transcriptional regulator [Nocardia cyriacigeorgica]|uniref:helix-turn-helix transcriptional regulator n=1 Tax=Nocardia cyriacigeorgica TaxID=135487 RepID=UPI0024538FAC|nr:LuxR family transcriptional regulator [Nocardia cyriacigeorgica]